MLETILLLWVQTADHSSIRQGWSAVGEVSNKAWKSTLPPTNTEHGTCGRLEDKFPLGGTPVGCHVSGRQSNSNLVLSSSGLFELCYGNTLRMATVIHCVCDVRGAPQDDSENVKRVWHARHVRQVWCGWTYPSVCRIWHVCRVWHAYDHTSLIVDVLTCLTCLTCLKHVWPDMPDVCVCVCLLAWMTCLTHLRCSICLACLTCRTWLTCLQEGSSSWSL